MANIVRHEPGRMLTLREAMDRLFEDAFLRPFGDWGPMTMGNMPPVDVEETDNEIIVTASVPGMKAEDLNITVNDSTLDIRGEMRSETERKEANYYLRERRAGSFQRSIPLPAMVKTDGARAEMDNGILTLTLPKAEEAKRRTITVKAKSR